MCLRVMLGAGDRGSAEDAGMNAAVIPSRKSGHEYQETDRCQGYTKSERPLGEFTEG
jgi:hypothetical protein